MVSVIKPPITGDEKMVRRPPKDKKKNTDAGNTVDPNYIEDIEKDIPFDEKFKNADAKKRKEMLACGGSVKKYKKGGNVSSCSKRADGVATKGKTKGRMV